MTQARRTQVDLSATPYYHCIARCVRRAFLCGQDDFSGRNYEHRREWVVERLKTLSETFAIQVLSFAVMSNHYHVVVHIDETQAKAWRDREVIERWAKLFPGSLAAAYAADLPMKMHEKHWVMEQVPTWRQRLHDLSWYMRSLNEWLARRANEEDKCSGRFWEGRFKSQALLDEKALLTCMSYVDLNPIRAKLARTPETSDYTSVKQRLHTRAGKVLKNSVPLMPFVDEVHGQSTEEIPMIPMERNDYLSLVDWTGRVIRHDKRGAIPAHIKPILERLQVQEKHWCDTVEHFGSRFYRFAGSVNRIQQAAERIGRRWVKGMVAAKRAYY